MYFDFVGPKFCQIYGIEKEGFLRDPSLAFSFTHPEDSGSLTEANKFATETGESFHWEGRYIINEKTIWVTISSEPTLLANGDTLWSGIINDITEAINLREEFKKLANTDDLTGISNRRHFMGRAEQELYRMHRFNRTMAVVLVDIDKFKSINDSYGHITGDLTIKEFVNICKPILREIDLFGRLGGDEFVMILSEIDLQNALFISERLRKAISETSVPCDDDRLIYMTSSFGFVISDKHNSMDKLLVKVDKALYKAKANDRDCVVYNE